MEKFKKSQFDEFREDHKDVIDTESYGKEFEDEEFSPIERVEPTKDINEMYENSIEKLYPKIIYMIDKEWEEKNLLTEGTRRWVETLNKMSANFLNVQTKKEGKSSMRVPGHSEISGLIRDKIKEDQERLRIVEERTKELEALRKDKK